MIADDHQLGTRFLMCEIACVLQQVKGSVTWQQLTVEVSGVYIPITNPNSLCKQIMALPGSEYKPTIFHPKLDKAKKQKRYEWVINLWMFWNSAKKFRFTAKVLLCHMNEI
jgi:hypothetical protein